MPKRRSMHVSVYMCIYIYGYGRMNIHIAFECDDGTNNSQEESHRVISGIGCNLVMKNSGMTIKMAVSLDYDVNLVA